MIAELWANMIISGKKELKDVPRMLKDRVKECLINKGRANEN